MPVEEVQAKPPAKPDDVPLRIYSNPICPYAQVCGTKDLPYISWALYTSFNV